ncbi:hypothetical protein Vadar_030326 [Vaccinium darrowii]|uniref:Uncharacterized protein n=1 Tax=Vaccinium darrowii TaxID=229202 RepID=A0ACB7ZMJ7_9ERIC|nr:hypothetical protein Vadar_030326 [Vaccinium darrowii]
MLHLGPCIFKSICTNLPKMTKTTRFMRGSALTACWILGDYTQLQVPSRWIYQARLHLKCWSNHLISKYPTNTHYAGDSRPYNCDLKRRTME